MKILLSHESAYEYIINHPELSYQRSVGTSRDIASFAYSKDDIGLTLEGHGLSNPVHLIVPFDRRFRSDGLVCHAYKTPLPPGSIIKIDSEVSVCSPELMLIQLAADGNVVLAAKRICDLCGIYLDSEPISRIEKIESFVNKVSGMRGTDVVRKALKYCLDNSGSPMETIMMLLLCLPTYCGGYGIPKPELNGRVDFNASAEKIAGKRYCVCDMLWKDAKLDVEYDSDMFHTGSDRIASDSKRRLALNSMGYSTISITRQQIKDRAEFHEVARVIAKRIGFRIRTSRANFDELQIGLRRMLFQSDMRKAR